MMEDLPLDANHPAVRDYLALIRLQVLTPLSLLVNITAVLVCSVAVTPGIQDIENMYPSSISPKPLLIATYLLLVYVGQVGYCILLVMAKKQETKKNHNQRGGTRPGACKLGHGIVGCSLDHAMVSGIHHTPWHIAVDLDILQRRPFDLPCPRNQEATVGCCIHPRPLETFLDPPTPSHVPIFALR